ncbi:MAG: ABC transporter ATP-binding protein [Phycisphaeraceae bacterium]
MDPLLKIETLAVSFPVAAKPEPGQSKAQTSRRVRAVSNVSMTIYPKQTLAVVGESGCGKSVTAMSILKLVPTPPGSYDHGSIHWNPDGKSPVNLLNYSDRQMQSIRGNQIAMIFQEPMTSLNPVYTVGEQIMEAVLLHQKVSSRQAVDIAADALTDVGIPDPRGRLKEYPHQLSGGMRQRIMIAMALACNPKLLLADEPTTALDVTIQAQILELLRDLQHKRDMAVMLITHDLGVVAENADVVAVMYAGRIVEYGSVHDVFQRPLHPYTKGLFGSMPVIGRTKDRLEAIPGNVPNPANFPSGCPFHPRCAATREKASLADASEIISVDRDGKLVDVMRMCVDREPPLLEVAPKHWVACHYAPGFAEGRKTLPDVEYRREPVAV